MTADEMLDHQLELMPAPPKDHKKVMWFNEHLEPTTFRLTGWASDTAHANAGGSASVNASLGAKADAGAAGKAGVKKASGAGGVSGRSITQFDFIGALETFEADWNLAILQFTNVTTAEKAILQYEHLSAGKSNSRDHGGAESAASKLSPAGVQKLCRSALYKDEWRCLGYPSPCT
jgi:hypothetical protein